MSQHQETDKHPRKEGSIQQKEGSRYLPFLCTPTTCDVNSFEGNKKDLFLVYAEQEEVQQSQQHHERMSIKRQHQIRKQLIK